MLGWWIVVERDGAENAPAIASWEASIAGIDWLDDLVATGKAEQTLFNGYPNAFGASAADVLPLIENGPPKHSSPLVVGDDYVSIGGWSRGFRFDKAQAAACDPNDRLTIEAWDLS